MLITFLEMCTKKSRAHKLRSWHRICLIWTELDRRITCLASLNDKRGRLVCQKSFSCPQTAAEKNYCTTTGTPRSEYLGFNIIVATPSLISGQLFIFRTFFGLGLYYLIDNSKVLYCQDISLLSEFKIHHLSYHQQGTSTLLILAVCSNGIA